MSPIRIQFEGETHWGRPGGAGMLLGLQGKLGGPFLAGRFFENQTIIGNIGPSSICFAIHVSWNRILRFRHPKVTRYYGELSNALRNDWRIPMSYCRLGIFSLSEKVIV